MHLSLLQPFTPEYLGLAPNIFDKSTPMAKGNGYRNTDNTRDYLDHLFLL